jgi:Ion channel
VRGHLESSSLDPMSNRRRAFRALRQPRSATELLVARVIVLAAFTVLVDLAVAFAFYRLERDVPGTEIRTYGDALFWTSSQITTISSSLRNPITAGGRVLAVATDFIAVATVSLLFGTIAQHIHIISPKRERQFNRDEDDKDAAQE